MAYSKRKPRGSPLFQCLSDHWEAFSGQHQDLFEDQDGPLRRRHQVVIGQFMECGLMDFGFVRVRCGDCGHELLLPFSCKTRGFCPSCAKKRECFFGEFLLNEVLERVTHRHVVFTIPKRLRGYFDQDRHLLPELSRMGYESVVEVLREQLDDPTGRGAAVIVSQTFGSLLDFTPHSHALVAWGLFGAEGGFTGAFNIPVDVIAELFRHKVFMFLLGNGLITEAIVKNMMGWHHSGFSVFVGPPVYAFQRDRLLQLASYMVRGPVALSRMEYDPEAELKSKEVKGLKRAFEEIGLDDGVMGKVTVRASHVHHKYGKNRREWKPLLFIRDLIRHIPDRHQKMTNYYGWYSNRARGDRKKRMEAEGEELVIRQLNPNLGKKLGHWRRFIKLIYETDPLICPNCDKEMDVVSHIHEANVVFKILTHLDLLNEDQAWETGGRDPPAKTG
jgi:hypothetical protein